VYSEARNKKRVTMSNKSNRANNEVESRGPSQPPDIENSPMAYPIPMEVPSRKPRGLKGKKLVFSSPIVADKVKPRRPFTRATSNQHVLVKDDTIEASSQ
jgi:hypothetical protein